ncbi:hypothetical protein JOL62DRAFT_220762 [Phyllosticta paracitricarpa]|uniref:Uncharacterized protein n=1 Tax=Phyllosticta paracitricarpa TaxID=2016321 RepID=A0ABR1N121_9PEZI
MPAWVHIFCFWPIHRSIPVSPTTVVSIHSAVLFLHHRCRLIKKLSDHPHWPAVGDSLLSVPLHLPSLQTSLESFSVFIFLTLILFLILCLTRYPRQFPRPIYHGARPSRDGRRTNGSLRRTSCRGISAPFQLFFFFPRLRVWQPLTIIIADIVKGGNLAELTTDRTRSKPSLTPLNFWLQVKNLVRSDLTAVARGQGRQRARPIAQQEVDAGSGVPKGKKKKQSSKSTKGGNGKWITVL